MTNPTILWTLLHSNAYEFVQHFVLFLSGKKERYRLSTHMLIFVINIRPARTFWNSTHCLLSPFTLDWSWNLLHNPMWNIAVDNIPYPIYPLSTRTEKCYITKMIPFFFCSVYIQVCTKNECWYWGVLLGGITSPLLLLHTRLSMIFIVWWFLNVFGFIWRFGRSNFTNWDGGSDGTNPSTTLYIRMRRRLSLLSSRVSSSRSCFIFVMVPGFLLW